MGRRDLAKIMQMARAKYSGGHLISYEDVMKLLGITQSKAQKKIEYLVSQKKGGQLVLAKRDSKGRGLYGPKGADKNRNIEANEETESARLLGYLKKMQPMPASIHDLQIATEISKEEYGLLKLRNVGKFNPANKQIEFKLNILGPEPRDSFATRLFAAVSTTGTVSIYSQLTQRPFRLKDEGDIYRIAQTLGEWRRALINKGLPATLPEVDKWVLQRVDINKDVTLSNEDSRKYPTFCLTIQRVYGTFKAYVKYLEGADEKRWVIRGEENKAYIDNPTIPDACERILSEEREKPLEERIMEANEDTEDSGESPKELADIFYQKFQTAKEMLDEKDTS